MTRREEVFPGLGRSDAAGQELGRVALRLQMPGLVCMMNSMRENSVRQAAVR